MSEFDPDAYLKSKAEAAPAAPAGFDPDAYLKTKGEPVGPAPGVAETVATNAADSLSLGFADEAYGVARAILSPKERFRTAYVKHRDAARARMDAGNAANPGAALTGQVLGTAGSFLLPTGAAGAGAKTLMGAIGRGAATGAASGGAAGLGASRSDLTKGEVGGVLADTALGAGLGATGGAVIGGAVKGAMQLPAAISGARSGLKAAPQVPSSAIGTAVSKTVGALRGASQGVTQADELTDAFRMVKPLLERKDGTPVAVGAGKILPGGKGPKPPEDTSLVVGLWREGKNPVKDYRASAASTGMPGNIDTQALQKWEELGAERRVTARRFRLDEAGKALAKEFRVFKDVLDTSTGEYANVMQNAARKATKLDPSVGDALDGTLARTLSAAAKDERGGGKGGAVFQSLREIRKVLRTGKSNLDYPGDGGGEWVSKKWDATKTQLIEPKLPAGEALFDRLQWARTQLDDLQNFNRDGKAPLAERTAQKIRKEIDEVLKRSAGKKEFDEFYTAKKILDTEFIDAVTVGKGRRKKIDGPKLRSVLQDNATGARFREKLDEVTSFIETHPAFEGKREKMLKPLEAFRAAAKTVEDKRLDQAVRQFQGPTSPGLARAEATFSKEGLLSRNENGELFNAISNPHAFSTSSDQFAVDTARTFFKKPFSKLTDAEEARLARAWQWVTQNPTASMGQKETALAKILGGK